MNKSRLALYLGIGFFLAGAVLFTSAYVFRFENNPDTRAAALLAKGINTADIIEVSVLSDAPPQSGQSTYRTKAYPVTYTIASVHRLSSEQTNELLRMMKSKDINTTTAACHNPGYLLTFISGSSTVLTCSLCFECVNVEVKPPFTAPVWLGMWDKGRLEDMKTFLHEVTTSKL